MAPESATFIIGAATGGVIVAIVAFMRGYFQHFGTRAAVATISWWLPSDNLEYSDCELREQTLELHNEIAEFQTRKQRAKSRNFWDTTGDEMSEEEIIKHQKQSSVRREERKGEFLKKFAPRLEMVLQEYEKRDITVESDTGMDFDSLRWWAEHGETSRILPPLRSLAQKLESDES